MPTSVRSHTKINLGLAIGPLRPDRFHQLTTVYQTLALYEWVTVEARSAAETRITLSSTHPRVPTDAGNTAWSYWTSGPRFISTSTNNCRYKAAWAAALPMLLPRS